VPLRNKYGLSVAKAIVRHVYLVYSAAELLVHDQGREFCNEINENIHTINDIVAKSVDKNQKKWDEVIPYTVFAYNTAVHRCTTYSPYYLRFGRQPVVNINFLMQNASPELSDNFDEFSQQVSDRMREAFAIVRNSLRCSFGRAKNVITTE